MDNATYISKSMNRSNSIGHKEWDEPSCPMCESGIPIKEVKVDKDYYKRMIKAHNEIQKEKRNA